MSTTRSAPSSHRHGTAESAFLLGTPSLTRGGERRPTTLSSPAIPAAATAAGTEASWWQRAVLYQIYLRSFKDTTGNGIGDLRGVIEKLPYVKNLGVDGICLSPISPCLAGSSAAPTADVHNSLFNIDPLFGDLATFTELVHKSHRLSLRILIDIVPYFYCDPNQADPATIASFRDMLEFWLELGIDGFRIQLESHPQLHQLLGPMRSLVDAYSEGQSPRVVLGQMPAAGSAPGAVATSDSATDAATTPWTSLVGSHGGALHMPLNSALIGVEWTAKAVRDAVDATEAALPFDGWPGYVMGGYDAARLASRLGRRGQPRLAAMLLLTLRGTPLLYNGDEIALRDVLGFGPEFERNACRAPMQWSDEPNAGFCPSRIAKPWVPLHSNWRVVNVERQLANASSLLNLYRNLLAYRRTSSALLRGMYRALDPSAPDALDAPADCFVYLREHQQERVLVALNFSDSPQVLRLSMCGTLVMSTDAARKPGRVQLDSVVLGGDEGVIIEL